MEKNGKASVEVGALQVCVFFSSSTFELTFIETLQVQSYWGRRPRLPDAPGFMTEGEGLSSFIGSSECTPPSQHNSHLDLALPALVHNHHLCADPSQ